MTMLLALALATGQLPQPEALSLQAVHNYGACIVEQSPAGARELLEMDFRTAEYQKKIRAIVEGHDRCMTVGTRMATGSILFAGAIAEALVKFDVKREQLPQRLAFDPARPAIQARSPLEAMALCTVLNAPQATATVFQTEPGTEEEIQAMRPLGPVLGECLKKDMKVELNKPAIRSLLALAAWRIESARGGTLQ